MKGMEKKKYDNDLRAKRNVFEFSIIYEISRVLKSLLTCEWSCSTSSWVVYVVFSVKNSKSTHSNHEWPRVKSSKSTATRRSSGSFILWTFYTLKSQQARNLNTRIISVTRCWCSMLCSGDDDVNWIYFVEKCYRFCSLEKRGRTGQHSLIEIKKNTGKVGSILSDWININQTTEHNTQQQWESGESKFVVSIFVIFFWVETSFLSNNAHTHYKQAEIAQQEIPAEEKGASE